MPKNLSYQSDFTNSFDDILTTDDDVMIHDDAMTTIEDVSDANTTKRVPEPKHKKREWP